jgi:DNA-binding transcriptional LysR family regulator
MPPLARRHVANFNFLIVDMRQVIGANPREHRRCAISAQLVQAGVANIGVGGGHYTTDPGLEKIYVGDVEMIPVAAPNHPLARGNPNPLGAAPWAPAARADGSLTL